MKKRAIATLLDGDGGHKFGLDGVDQDTLDVDEFGIFA